MRSYLTLLITFLVLNGCATKGSNHELVDLVEKHRISNEVGDLNFIMSIYPDTLTMVIGGEVFHHNKINVNKRRKQDFEEIYI